MPKSKVGVSAKIGRQSRIDAEANMGFAKANLDMALNLKKRMGALYKMQGKIGKSKVGAKVQMSANNIGAGFTLPYVGTHYLGLKEFGLMPKFRDSKSTKSKAKTQSKTSMSKSSYAKKRTPKKR